MKEFRKHVITSLTLINVHCSCMAVISAPSSFRFLKRSNDQSRHAWNVIYQKQSDSTFKGYLEKLNQKYEKNEKGDLSFLMKN